jgi:hypothetical protein
MISPWKYAESNTEHSHQVALFMWASVAVDLAPDLKWMHAIPNGGSRGDTRLSRMIRGGQLKAEGVKEGVADIFLPVPVFQFHGLYIELKRLQTGNKKVTSTEQDNFLNYANQKGYCGQVAIGWEQAKSFICVYLALDEIKIDTYVTSKFAAKIER